MCLDVLMGNVGAPLQGALACPGSCFQLEQRSSCQPPMLSAQGLLPVTCSLGEVVTVKCLWLARRGCLSSVDVLPGVPPASRSTAGHFAPAAQGAFLVPGEVAGSAAVFGEALSSTRC